MTNSVSCQEDSVCSPVAKPWHPLAAALINALLPAGCQLHHSKGCQLFDMWGGGQHCKRQGGTMHLGVAWSKNRDSIKELCEKQMWVFKTKLKESDGMFTGFCGWSSSVVSYMLTKPEQLIFSIIHAQLYQAGVVCSIVMPMPAGHASRLIFQTPGAVSSARWLQLKQTQRLTLPHVHRH